MCFIIRCIELNFKDSDKTAALVLTLMSLNELKITNQLLGYFSGQTLSQSIVVRITKYLYANPG